MPCGCHNPAPMRQRLRLYLQLIRWDRPAGWLLLLWPTLSALWIAADGFPGWHLLLVFSLGTVLMRSAGCCINDVADRDFDRHVKRTAQRPVTSGALSPIDALMLGALLAAAAELLGRPIIAGERGGASDASHFAAAIDITIDGLGPCGDHSHHADEYIDLDSLFPRSELVLALLDVVLRSRSL